MFREAGKCRKKALDTLETVRYKRRSLQGKQKGDDRKKQVGSKKDVDKVAQHC